MGTKVFWVRYEIDARVEVQVDDDMTPDEIETWVHDCAKEQICSAPEEYISLSNLTEITEEE